MNAPCTRASEWQNITQSSLNIAISVDVSQQLSWIHNRSAYPRIKKAIISSPRGRRRRRRSKRRSMLAKLCSRFWRCSSLSGNDDSLLFCTLPVDENSGRGRAASVNEILTRGGKSLQNKMSYAADDYIQSELMHDGVPMYRIFNSRMKEQKSSRYFASSKTIGPSHLGNMIHLGLLNHSTTADS